MTDNKFEHRTRGDVPANSFAVTAYRQYQAITPTGKDWQGQDYCSSSYEFETEEHPGWVFGIGSEESNWAYRTEWLGDVEKMKDIVQYGWSNWGPYWDEDPYVFEKFPIPYWDDDGKPVFEKDTWNTPGFEDHIYTLEETYYSISQELIDGAAVGLDQQLLIDKIGYDPTYWDDTEDDD